MIGVDDLVDESVWINVQDPVRQMITAITKAVRTQSAGIRDLDRKISTLSTKEHAERLVKDAVSSSCSKSEASDIIREMDARSNELKSNYMNFEDRMTDFSDKLNKMNEILSNQTVAITNINSRMEKLADDIDDVKMNPNYDAIYAYIDRQVFNISISTL